MEVNRFSAQLTENSFGLSKLSIQSQLATAEIYLQGAQITKFQPKGESDLLWLSPLSHFDGSKPIRGGIPICWPWFGKHTEKPDLPQHGFARMSEFRLKSLYQLDDGTVSVKLQLSETPETLALWPYSFLLTVGFEIGTTLTVSVTTTNTSTRPMPITQAIHSYFNVSNINDVELKGLEHTKFLDKLTQQTQQLNNQSVSINGEVDRIHTTHNARLQLQNKERIISIEQNNEDSTVVWNPWIEKSETMNDFPDHGYTEMLCVEAANTEQNKVIKLNERYQLRQSLAVTH